MLYRSRLLLDLVHVFGATDAFRLRRNLQLRDNSRVRHSTQLIKLMVRKARYAAAAAPPALVCFKQGCRVILPRGVGKLVRSVFAI